MAFIIFIIVIKPTVLIGEPPNFQIFFFSSSFLWGHQTFLFKRESHYSCKGAAIRAYIFLIGDQVVVGACGSGRWADCPNDSIYYDNSYHQILCCTIPEFNWNHCESYGSEHGVLNSCLEHGEVPTILEGTCGSGNYLIHGLLYKWTELLYLTCPHEADLFTLIMLQKLI